MSFSTIKEPLYMIETVPSFREKALKWDKITKKVLGLTLEMLIVSELLSTTHSQLVDKLNLQLKAYGLMEVTSITEAINRLPHQYYWLVWKTRQALRDVLGTSPNMFQ